MQQELIEMLDKMVKYFDEIPSDSYYYRETAAILNEAEKLVEKAKNGAKEPAVPQGEPVQQGAIYEMADALYKRGYTDRQTGKDYDPRGCDEWQEVVDWLTPAPPSQPSKYGSPELQALIVAHATQSHPVTLRDYADSLIEAGHEFWKACRRDAGGGAVRWLSCDDGTLIVFTRGEYRDAIMGAVGGYRATEVVFEDQANDEQGGVVACAATSQPLTDEVFRPIVKAVFDAGWATCRASELVGDNAKEFAWDMYGDELTERLIAAILPQEPVTLTDEPPQKFVEWLEREMPPETVILNASWWAPRIYGAVIAALHEKEQAK